MRVDWTHIHAKERKNMSAVNAVDAHNAFDALVASDTARVNFIVVCATVVNQ